MSDTPDHEMPESADPIDRAYVQAEAVLSPETLGDAARAARRARLLAAVASEPATAASSAAPRRPARRDFGWGRGGWLAAACVAGLSVFVGLQIYQPVPRPPPVAPSAPASPRPVTGAPPPAAVSKPPELGAAVPRSAPPAPASPPIAPRPRSVPPAAPPSSPVVIVAERRAPAADSGGYLAAPAPPPPAPPPPASNADASADSSASTTVTDEIVTRQRRAPVAPPKGSADSVSDSVVTDIVVTAERRRQATQKVPVAVSAFTAAKRDVVGVKAASGRAYAKPLDPGAALRAAAAAGQTAEVETLLTQGTPIDAPDAKGDTALIVSIRADHPDVAAILRQHGASLDHRNHAGESARDLAKASGDAALGRALGLAP